MVRWSGRRASWREGGALLEGSEEGGSGIMPFLGSRRDSR